MNTFPRKMLLGALWLFPFGIGLFIGNQTADKQATFPDPSSMEAAASHRSTSTRTVNSSAERNNSLSNTFSLNGSAEERREQACSQLADILNVSDRVERTRQLLAFIDQLSPLDFESVISGFSEAGWVDFNRGEFSFLLSSWMSQDPLAAIEYLKQNEEDGWSRKVAISAWASENPEAAANAIKGLEDGGKVNDWIVGLIQGMARSDPQAALLAIQQMPKNDTQKTAIREILPEVVSRGIEFAGEWIEMIDDPKLQNDTARRLGGVLAKRDPVAASDWVSQLKTVNSRRNASEVVSEIYASQDLDAAITWTESLPQDTLTEAAEGVAKHLARRDPAEAAYWLQQLGNDPDLDGARIQFIRESMNNSPEVTLENIHTLSRPADQDKYYRHVLGTWKKSNQEAAISWAQENSESISEKVYKSIVPKKQRAME